MEESKYGSRKFFLALLVVFLATGLSMFGYLTPLLVELFKWVTGLYLGFNVTQRAAEWLVNKPESK